MNNLGLRFERLERRGLLSPIKGLPCPICKVNFSDCKHSYTEVEDAIKWWRENKKYMKMFGVSTI